MGFRSFLNCWRKSKSQPKPSTPENSSSTPSDGNVREREEVVRSQPENPMVKSSSSSYAKELEEVFRRFDANGDGKLSWEELGWIMSSLGQQATPEEIQRMIREVDSDGDGCISLDEFIQLNTKDVDYGVALDDIRNSFSFYDVDGDGFISCGELHRFLRKLGYSSTVEDCQRMIAAVDRDGDGLVSFEEFKRMMMKHSSRVSG